MVKNIRSKQQQIEQTLVLVVVSLHRDELGHKLLGLVLNAALLLACGEVRESRKGKVFIKSECCLAKLRLAL